MDYGYMIDDQDEYEEAIQPDNCYKVDMTGITDRRELHACIARCLPLPEWYGCNLDALYDVLSEYDEDVSFIFTRENTRRITREEYAWKVVMIIARCMQENPHIHMLFRE